MLVVHLLIPDSEVGIDGIDLTDGTLGMLGTILSLSTEAGITVLAGTTDSISHLVLITDLASIMDSTEDLVVSVAVLLVTPTFVLQLTDLLSPTLIIPR